MLCGTHQRGFLSLLKYIAFIILFRRAIEESSLDYIINGIPTNTVGYVVNISAC